jgi:serine/threonine protein kinase
VIFFELCAGHTLFSQDTSNDELIETHDHIRLCTWHTIDDETLSRVLRNSNATDEMKSDARNLIRWCLKGNPDARPTVTDLLESRLLRPHALALSSRAPRPKRMKYHGFLSHAQVRSPLLLMHHICLHRMVLLTSLIISMISGRRVGHSWNALL